VKRLISLTWLRLERIPMLAFDLLPGALLVVGGVTLISLATCQSSL
jgi:hypothetical protein